MNINLEYEYKAIAYLDILGFRQLVKNEDKLRDIYNLLIRIPKSLPFSGQTESFLRDPNYFEGILNKLQHCYKNIVQTKENNTVHIDFGAGVPIEETVTHQSIELSMFSDNFFFSVPANDPIAVACLIQEVKKIQRELVKNHQVLCRGALHVGKCFHKGSVIFGQAVTEGYLTEQKVAHYPRIILTASFMDLLDKNKILELFVSNSIISQDFDGFYYINYPLQEVTLTQNSGELTVGGTDHPSFSIAFNEDIKKIANSQIKLLKTDAVDESEKLNILGKWQWLSNLCDRNIQFIHSEIKRINS